MSIDMRRRQANQSRVFDSHRLRWGLPLVLAGCVALLAGCGEGAAPDGASSAPASQQQASGSGGGSAYTIDMDAIFPQEPGRDLVLNNCQNCHTWVPIVILQMNEQEWDRWAREHRQRVEGLSDEQFGTLLSYVKTNFNPDTPVPELPPALLEAWTTY